MVCNALTLFSPLNLLLISWFFIFIPNAVQALYYQGVDIINFIFEIIDCNWSSCIQSL